MCSLGTQPFLVRTVSPHYLTDYSRWRHPAARFGRFANDFPVSAAGLCIQRIAPDSETRLQKVGSLRCAFLASPLVHGWGACNALLSAAWKLPKQSLRCFYSHRIEGRRGVSPSTMWERLEYDATPESPTLRRMAGESGLRVYGCKVAQVTYGVATASSISTMIVSSFSLWSFTMVLVSSMVLMSPMSSTRASVSWPMMIATFHFEN